MIVFQSERMFSVYTYLYGHGVLLLRSFSNDAPKGTPERIDVLFKDVRYMDIKVWLTGISISESLPDEAGNESHLKDLLEPGLKIFRIQSQDWHGSILAGAIHVAEDSGSWMGCSALLRQSLWADPFGPVAYP